MKGAFEVGHDENENEGGGWSGAGLVPNFDRTDLNRPKPTNWELSF